MCCGTVFKGLVTFAHPHPQIVVDSYLRSVGDPSGSVYALGDCASNPAHPLPCTAQVAEREGRYLAQALNESDPKPFVFKSSGMLAYVGGYKALHDTPVSKSQGLG